MKNFKKTLACMALVLAMGISIVACGNEKSVSESGGEATTSSKGDIIDSGLFSAVCPDGFLNIPQSDPFGEQDSEGNFPPNKELLMFSYGAKNETDAFSKPSVNISLTKEDTTIDYAIEMFDLFYENIEETTFNIGGTDYRGIEADYKGLTENDVYHYQVVFLEQKERVLEVTVVTKMPDMENTGLSVDNASVQSIIESISLN